MKDPVWGGYTAERIALRRAISLAYNLGEEISLVRNGTADRGADAAPAGRARLRPGLHHRARLRPGARQGAARHVRLRRSRRRRLARSARRQPARLHTTRPDPSQLSRLFTELWKKNLDAIGSAHGGARSPSGRTCARSRRRASCRIGNPRWNADYPDGENFYQLLYGPNCGSSNDGCFQLRASTASTSRPPPLPPGPERTAHLPRDGPRRRGLRARGRSSCTACATRWSSRGCSDGASTSSCTTPTATSTSTSTCGPKSSSDHGHASRVWRRRLGRRGPPSYNSAMSALIAPGSRAWSGATPISLPARPPALASSRCLRLAAGSAGAAVERKVLRMALRTAEAGFDPQRIDDRYSVGICENLFEPLLTYDYLARPVEARAARGRGDAGAGGGRHPLHRSASGRGSSSPTTRCSRAQSASSSRSDVEYAIKRFRDPKNRSPYEWLFENKIVGLDELAAQAAKSGRFDYDAKVAGPRGARPLHHQLQAHGARLQLPLRAGDAQRGAGGARGDRGLRRRHARASRGHRALRAQGVGAPLEDRAREESQPPRLRARRALRRPVGPVGPGRDRGARAASAFRSSTAWRSIRSRTTSRASSPSSTRNTTCSTRCRSRSSTRCCPTAGSRPRSRSWA